MYFEVDSTLDEKEHLTKRLIVEGGGYWKCLHKYYLSNSCLASFPPLEERPALTR